MKTAAYSQVLASLSDELGWNADNLDAPQWNAARRAISKALTECWEEHAWRETVRVELRRFHPDYDPAATVAAGEFRYHPPSDTYYQALRQTIGNPPASQNLEGTWETDNAYWIEAQRSFDAQDWEAALAYVPGEIVYDPENYTVHACHTATTPGTPPADTDYWGEISELRPLIPYTAAGRHPIGRVLALTRLNPRSRCTGIDLVWEETDEGIAIPCPTLTGAWVRFQQRPNTFTGTFWDDGAMYEPGDGDDFITPETLIVTTNYSAIFEWTIGNDWRFRTSIPDDDNVPVTGTIVWPDGSGGTFTRTHKSDIWRRYTGFILTHSASGGTITQPEFTIDDAGNVVAMPDPIITGFAQTLNQTLTLASSRYRTIAEFQAATVLSDVVLIVEDDQGNSGTFWLDETDTTTPHDGVNTIVDAAGKRFKRS